MDNNATDEGKEVGKGKHCPNYNVDFWEYVYEREKQRYDTLVAQKTKRLQALQDKDLFALPEKEAMQTQRSINYLTYELSVLDGFKLFTEDMRKCYIDSIDKTYAAYHDRNEILQLDVYHMKRGYDLLLEDYLQSLDDKTYWLEYAIKLKQQKHKEDEQ